MSDDKKGPILFLCGGGKKDDMVKLKIEVPKTLFDRYKATMGGKTTDQLFAEFMRDRLYGPPDGDDMPPPLGAA